MTGSDEQRASGEGEPDYGAASAWSEHYAQGDTPWDLGGPHPELSARLQDGRLVPPHDGARALVPGAGRSHDALALARRGWVVTALDLVAGLEDSVGASLSKLGGRFVTGNAFEFDDAPYDLIWDHTFFCAIDPAQRGPWGERARALLVPGGHYAALVFPVGKPAEEGGPPHGMDVAAAEAALGPLFRTIESVAVTRPVKRRTWRESWFVAERTRLRTADGE